MNRTLLPLAAALVTFACGDSQPTSPDGSADAAARLSRSESRSGSGCRDVQGTIVEYITGPNTAAGKITGDVSGDVSIVITALRQMEGGVVQFDAHCTMVTADGTFNATDQATLTPIEAPLYRVNNRLAVSGGTGEYSGVTGKLHTHGTANFVPGGLVDLRYRGQLCKTQ